MLLLVLLINIYVSYFSMLLRYIYSLDKWRYSSGFCHQHILRLPIFLQKCLNKYDFKNIYILLSASILVIMKYHGYIPYAISHNNLKLV